MKSPPRTGRARCSAFLTAILFLQSPFIALADWPAYRHDMHRSGVTAESVDEKLNLQWRFIPRHAPQPAWPLPGEETPRMHTDRAYHVVESDGLAYFGSSIEDKLYAVDSATGEVRWTYFAGGAIRFAPIISGGKIYFGSDDGYAYCLDAKSGDEVWKYRPSPADEHVIGNGRMVSLWPLRTGLIIKDGIVYLTAGIFPYEGLYVCAVDAQSGKEIWKNDTAGDLAWGLEYGGMAPQGYLLGSEKFLYVPSGRGMPAAFDKSTGRFVSFLSAGGKIGGSWAMVDPSSKQLVAGVNNQGKPAKIAYDTETGQRKGDIFASFPGIDLVLTREVAYSLTESGIVAIDRAAYRHAAAEIPELRAERKRLGGEISKNRKNTKKASARVEELKSKPESKEASDELTSVQKELTTLRIELGKITTRLSDMSKEESKLEEGRVIWNFAQKNLNALVLTASAAIAGGDGFVVMVDPADGSRGWESKVDGLVLGLAVSDGRVFVSTDKGTTYCFSGAADIAPKTISPPVSDNAFADNQVYASAAERLLEESGISKGFCLVMEAGEGQLAYEIARRSDLYVVGIERDPAKLRAGREKLDRMGLYGKRIIIEPWEYAELPDYFANLIVSQGMIEIGKLGASASEIYRVLRPAGGVAMLGQPAGTDVSPDPDHYKKWFESPGLPKPSHLVDDGNWWKLNRKKLKGSGDWTGLYGNPSNTGSSPDEAVRGPFGVLWFGEPGSKYMPDRHARSVSPLAVNGRLLVQGMEVVMGFDAYNGTFLWERKIPGAVRLRVDVDGSNITANDDHMFVAAYDTALQLDAQTGKIVHEFKVPKSADGKMRRWGYIAVVEGTLFGSAAMPMKQDFGELWTTLARDGKWIPESEVPGELKEIYDKIVGRYPAPNDRALEGFKRDGMNWRFLTKFPGWMPDHKVSPVTDRMMISDALFAYDIASGDLLWKHEGPDIPAISITLGNGQIFFVQSGLTDDEKQAALAQRKDMIADGAYVAHDEEKLPAENRDLRRVVALDTKTGKENWSKPMDLSGCGGNKLGTAFADGKLLFFGHYSNHDEGAFVSGTLNWRRISVLSDASGSMEWSKPLNYRRRPLIMGDTIYIEPRACSLADGTIKKRVHPITSQEVDWEFLRPGHSCGIVTASPHSIFYRSFCAAIVNVEKDTGLQLFGGMRPGCWNNLIPANGLLSMQEASAGCTCSYSLRTTVVMKNKAQKGPGEWSVFISNAPTTPVANLAVNFGAPGDMRDNKGTLWFAYPRPNTRIGQGSFRNYGVKFDLKQNEGVSVRQRDFRGVTIEGSERPWLFTNSAVGLTKFQIHLIDKEQPAAKYRVRLGFVAEPGSKPGDSSFSIRLQGNEVLAGFDAAAEAGKSGKAIIKEYLGVAVAEDLLVELAPIGDSTPALHFIEVTREEG